VPRRRPAALQARVDGGPAVVHPPLAPAAGALRGHCPRHDARQEEACGRQEGQRGEGCEAHGSSEWSSDASDASSTAWINAWHAAQLFSYRWWQHGPFCASRAFSELNNERAAPRSPPVLGTCRNATGRCGPAPWRGHCRRCSAASRSAALSCREGSPADPLCCCWCWVSGGEKCPAGANRRHRQHRAQLWTPPHLAVTALPLANVGTTYPHLLESALSRTCSG
jgi:hypothetical protein